MHDKEDSKKSGKSEPSLNSGYKIVLKSSPSFSFGGKGVSRAINPKKSDVNKIYIILVAWAFNAEHY